MSRKKLLSDEDILTAAQRVMSQTGPSGFTLAAVGREIGMSPATLLQRFGSKRGLMLAVVSGGAAGTEQAFADALAKAGRPLRALVDLLSTCAGFIAKPEELANHLAFLQMDLCDPDFHAHTLAQTQATLRGVERFLTAARAANEIRVRDVKRLANTVCAVYQGSLLIWCVVRLGDVTAYVRNDLEAALSPYIVPKKLLRPQ